MRQILKWQRWLYLALILTTLTICGSELADWVGCNVANKPSSGKSCGVLVRGYPSHNDRTANPVQESRVAAGVRADRDRQCDRIVSADGDISTCRSLVVENCC